MLKLQFLQRCLFCVHNFNCFSQTYQIPTMENGPDLTKRFHKELTDIQVKGFLLLHVRFLTLTNCSYNSRQFFLKEKPVAKKNKNVFLITQLGIKYTLIPQSKICVQYNCPAIYCIIVLKQKFENNILVANSVVPKPSLLGPQQIYKKKYSCLPPILFLDLLIIVYFAY